MATTGQSITFTLPNKTVYLVPNPNAIRTEYMGVKNHDGAFLLTGTSVSWVLPMNEDGTWVNIFNSKEERDFIAEALGLNLDIFKKDNDLKGIRVKIYKDSPDLKQLKLTLDLNNPMEYLYYLLLRKQPDIAPTWENREDRTEYKWVLREKHEENQIALNKAEVKSKLYAWLNKVADNKATMYNVLKVYGVNVVPSLKKEDLFVRLSELIDGDLKTIKRLTEVIKDKDLQIKIDIELYVTANLLIRQGATYVLPTGERIGDLNGVIAWMNQPQNSILVDTMKQKAQLFKEENNI